MSGYPKQILGWMMYDWAAQPFYTILITFIFAPYFVTTVIGDPVLGQGVWAVMTASVGIVLAFAAPILGAIADTMGSRRPWIIGFSALYVFGSLGLWWAVPDMNNPAIILIIFAIGYLGAELSHVFISAMLPDLAHRHNWGKFSAHAFAVGYAGGLVLLFILLFFFVEGLRGRTLLGIAPIFGLDPNMREGTRIVGPLVALWYILFMIPFFAWIPRGGGPGGAAPSSAIAELLLTIRKLPQNMSLLSYLGAVMFYRDALVGLYAFGGIYAAGVLGWSIQQIGIFGIIGGICAVLSCWIGGYVDQRIGPRAIIITSIVILMAVSLLIIGTTPESFMGVVLGPNSAFADQLFYICGALAGGVGGILQAASRTMMARLANPDRMTEAFGLFTFVGRVTAWLAPGAVALVTYLTKNQQLGLAPIVILFIVSLCLMFWVDPADS